MDQIHEAFNELLTLGAIVSFTNETITINRQRLYKLGYTITFNICEPVFVSLLDFNYMYNTILYDDDVLPKSSLNSYVLLKLKTMHTSF
ncbi:hypothetical protein [Mauternbach virus]|uniref:Uncharacterized protein n=1 Tax=Mauternbach virus TaxID=2486603 RepID=A0A3G3E7B0_9VIRU|nr:hypothetical protein QKM05_gp28 [Mauternbach virus]AYP97981.1 hypothetical protein [Mauternbach virus]